MTTSDEVNVGDIVRAIADPGDDLVALTFRVQNWGKEGLLKPLGQKYVGTGRRRRYPKLAIVDALIIKELAEWGIPAVLTADMQVVKEKKLETLPLLTFARAAYEKFSKSENVPLWLCVSRNRDHRRRGARAAYYGRVLKDAGLQHIALDDRAPSTIVLNLTDLFQQLRKNLEEQ